MVVALLGTFAIAASIAAILKLRTAREIDILSFVLNYFVVKTRLLEALTILGLADRLRPKSVTKVTTKNNFEFTTAAPQFLALQDYVWNFETRLNDVFVATYPKAGTTWVQEIVWLICNNADTGAAAKTYLSRRSPFLESVDIGDNLGLQSLEKWPTNSARVIKTHQPYEILPREVTVEGKGKVVYVTRNPKDLCVSYFYFHHMSFALPQTGTWEEFLSKFSNGDVSWGDWASHTKKYWEESIRSPEQIYFATYEALKTNLAREVKSIAQFLGKHLTDEQVDSIAKHCTFDNMSKNKSTNYENLSKGAAFDFSEAKFMRKGQIGDWKNHFTINQSQAFDEVFEEKLKGTGLKFIYE